MDYDYAIESRDYGKIDKLNALKSPYSFWSDVIRLTKNVKSGHAMRRWECLADARWDELVSEHWSNKKMTEALRKEAKWILSEMR